MFKKKIPAKLNENIVLIIVGLGIAFLMTAVLGLVEESQNEDDDHTTVTNYTIENYNVKLDVQKDNKVDVTETITVNFLTNSSHGIYKFTPEWLQYTGKDGKTIKRKSIVKDLMAENETYVNDVVNKKVRIKIGDADKTLSKGLKTYTIKYTYDMGKDPFDGYDEFIFHAFGDYWGTEIKNASIEVKLPEGVVGKPIHFFNDKYRKEDVTDYVDYKHIGSTITATFNAEKYREAKLNEYCKDEINQKDDGSCNEEKFDKLDYGKLTKALTIDLELPEGYFEGGSWNYGYYSLTIIIASVIITIMVIGVWYKYGKDYKSHKTVEFYPPEGLDASEIGYIYSGQSGSKLYISLIVQLAAKGYIKIDELDGKKGNIQLTNLYEKPKKVEKFEKYLPKRTIVVRKLKDNDPNLSSSARAMMSYLFIKSDERKLSTNIKAFLKERDYLINGGYIKIVSDNEQEIEEATKSAKEKYDADLKEYERKLAKYERATKDLKPLSENETIVYESLFQFDQVVLLKEHRTLYSAFAKISNNLNTKMNKKINDKTATKKMIISIIITIVVFFAVVVNYTSIEDLDPAIKDLYGISFACPYICLFFALITGRKTKYGEDISARIMGFREFLLKVEKPRLEELVSQNPEYFYDILPYTYVLHISKKWIKKFEGIPILERDMGTFNYSSDSSYFYMSNDVYYPTSSSSGGSSSSSCGGGCSSCGGGCSSCGGGGSW